MGGEIRMDEGGQSGKGGWEVEDRWRRGRKTGRRRLAGEGEGRS